MRTSLPEILSTRADNQPASRAYVFLNEHGEEKDLLTYGDLHTRALAVAQHLCQQSAPGDRALLVFPPGLDFIVAYFGCLYAGVIAVPVNPPRRNRVRDATHAIVRDCAPSTVLTVSTLLDTTRQALEPVHGGLRWLPVDRLPAASEFTPRRPPADAIAFLQYTSGSTADPKGVMVSHRNLVANQEMIQRAFGTDRHSTVVGWTPLFHDQGLIGNVLHPLYLGATSILLSPMAFLRWPLSWLSAISRYRAHTSGGPNFAFDACVSRAARGTVPDLDLSCWRVAFNGAEPIRHDTLRRFTETFAPYGFRETALYPCYGLAEATLLVTGSEQGRGARTVEADADELTHGRYAAPANARSQVLTGSGVVRAEDDLRIVNPETGHPCPENEVGEVWVAGEHVAPGYWRRPQATVDTFLASCAGVRGHTYLRTGDLGLVIDRELYIVGRQKDLVIIRGRNYYPQDIEHTVQSAHPALKPDACAVFSVPGDKLVVVQEIRRDQRRTTDARDVIASIREAITREHELTVSDLVLTLPGRLEKTGSGKIRRAAARKLYLDAGFEVWAPDADPQEGLHTWQSGTHPTQTSNNS